MESQFLQWMAARGADPARFSAGYNLISAGDLLVALYSDALKELEITRDEWRILVILTIASESEPRRLAEMLWLGRSTVVNALTRLEKRGFITRNTATNDRRLVVVRITPAGEEMVEEGARRQAELLNSLAWEMDSQEVDALARLARRVWRLNYRRVPKSIDSSPRVSEATT